MARTLEQDIKSLDNKTVGQQYKIVNEICKLVINNKYSTAEIDLYLKSWTYSESTPLIVLYLSLVNFMKRSDIVTELLKSENDLLISRVIRLCTFLGSNETYTVDFYITQVFPYLSYINRNRLLKRIAESLHDEQKIGIFFDGLKKSYGFSTARIFLIYCDKAYVINLLRQKVVLTLRELKVLFSKDPTFVLCYIQELCKINSEKENLNHLIPDHVALISLILVSYTTETLKIIDENKKWLQLRCFGENVTKRILQSSKEMILKDSKFYVSLLKRSVVFRMLTEQEYELFFKGLLPENVDDIQWNELISYLSYYTQKQRKLKLLLESYKAIYNKDLLDDVTNIPEEVMKLLDEERRVDFAKQKVMLYNDDDSDDRFKWISYFTCDEAINIFKTEISVTPLPNKRMVLLEMMVESCQINDDMASMLQVLKYFNDRHRNEDVNVRLAFFNAISDNINLQNFSHEHWEQIRNFIAFTILNKEQNYFYNMGTVITASLKYSLKNNLSVKQDIIHFLYTSSWQIEPFNLFKDNRIWEKKCLCLFADLVPEVMSDEADRYRYLMHVLTSFVCWNKRYPSDTLSAMNYEWMVEQIVKILESENDYEKENIVKHLKYDEKANIHFKAKLREIPNFIYAYNLKDIFKAEPDLVLKQIDSVCEKLSNFYYVKRVLLPILKSHKIDRIDELKSLIKSYCLSVMDKNSMKYKASAVYLLSHWLLPDEFYSMVKSFYPETSCVDLNEKPIVHDIRKSVIYALKNYAGHTKTFDALKVFCVRDFMKFTIGSLNSVCMNSPTYKTAKFLESNIDVPVSFKKHVIRLCCLIHNKSFVIEFLQKLWLQEKNVSMRQILLRHMFKNFTDDPGTQILLVLKTSLESLSANDKHSLPEVINLVNVSDVYLNEYIELILSTLNKLESDNVNVNCYKISVFQSILDNLNLITDETVENILNKHLFDPNGNMSLQTTICNLAAHYILKGPNQTVQAKRLKFIFIKMKTSFDSFWNTTNSNNSYCTRQSINCFIERMCVGVICEQKFKNMSDFILPSLLINLDSVFDSALFIYTSHIMVHLSTAFKDADDNVKFGVIMRSLLSKEICNHGSHITPLFADALNFFMEKINHSKHISEVVDGLLSEPIPFIDCAYLALNIMKPKTIFKVENQHILTRLRNINDKIVNMILNLYY